MSCGTRDEGKRRGHLPVLQQTRANVARGQKVAVIGAGPAGIAAAHDLALMGYRVTVFEATNQAGGMMYHGIPEFRLARSIIEKEIQKVAQLGVEIRFNTPLNEKFGIRELKAEGFESVFLSVGVQKGRDMNIEGSNLDGVIKAIDYPQYQQRLSGEFGTKSSRHRRRFCRLRRSPHGTPRRFGRRGRG